MKKEMSVKEKVEYYERIISKYELALMGLDVSKAEIENKLRYLRKFISENK